MWTRDALVVGLATVVVAAALAQSDHLGAFPSAVVGGLLACGAAALMARAAGVSPSLVRVALLGYCVAAMVGAVVIANNQANYGIPFTAGFDDSLYWTNAERIAEGLGDDDTHATLFEHLAAGYYRLLALGGAVTPADLLPLNWALSALTVAASLGVAEALVGRAPPVGLALLATYGNAQFCLCVPHFYRDMLVSAGFVAAALFALRGRVGLAVAASLVVLGTRTAHGFLALFVVAVVVVSRTRSFARHPRLIAGVLALTVSAGALLVSRGSAAMLSGRQGESDARDVASYTVTRQREVVEHLQSDGSSLGAMVIGLGPAGIPLRMVSGYFAPVTLVNPVVERSFNTLLIPWRLGDVVRVERFVAFMLVYWVTVVAWPALAAPLILGMRRLERAPGPRRVTLRALALCFFLVMAISMQERHRVPLLAFNPVLLAAWTASPPTPSERHLAHWITAVAVVALIAANLYVAVR